MNAHDVQRTLKLQADSDYAAALSRFFKTDPGEYGEGDVFIGVRMPAIRSICKTFAKLPLSEVSKVVESPIHEERMAGLIILANRAKKTQGEKLGQYFDFYLDHLHRGHINNWDLVDATCKVVVGRYLVDKDRSILYALARSDSLWERRVAIVSSSAFIGLGESTDTLALSKQLLSDRHDLIHKATGWMLREVGKHCGENTLKTWLDQHATHMPRTMLRYAIERLPKDVRTHYLELH